MKYSKLEGKILGLISSQGIVTWLFLKWLYALWSWKQSGVETVRSNRPDHMELYIAAKERSGIDKEWDSTVLTTVLN